MFPMTLLAVVLSFIITHSLLTTPVVARPAIPQRHSSPVSLTHIVTSLTHGSHSRTTSGSSHGTGNHPPATVTSRAPADSSSVLHLSPKQSRSKSHSPPSASPSTTHGSASAHRTGRPICTSCHSSSFGALSSSSSGHTGTAIPISVTSIPFIILSDSNPAPSSGQESETFIAPGVTTNIPVPTTTTVIDLGPQSTLNTTQTVTNVVGGIGGESTVFSTVTSTSIVNLQITVGPGGVIIGAIPTLVSQPGLSSPTFNTNPIPPAGATELTFTGMRGFSTVVPIPIRSPTTIVIDGLSGGGSIELGTDGAIIGTLPAGIVEVGALLPVPVPVGAPADPQATDTPSKFSSSASSTQSSASASRSCAVATATACATACAVESQGTDVPATPVARKVPVRSLGRNWSFWKRSSHRQMGTGCKNGIKVFSQSNAVNDYEKVQVPHSAFGLKIYTGSSFDMDTTHPANKPPNSKNDPRNKDLNGCDGAWCGGCSHVLELANPGLGFNPFIWSQRFKISVGNYEKIGKAGLQRWTNDARAELLNLMRGFAAAVPYLNANAPAFKATAEAIIVILQAYDRRKGSPQSPPIAVQFHEHLIARVGYYQTSGQTLALDLAREFDRKIKTTNFQCPATEKTLSDVSIIAFVIVLRLTRPHIQISDGLSKTWPTLASSTFLPDRPLCFPNDSPGVLNFAPIASPGPERGVNEGPFVVVNAATNGNNIQVDLAISDSMADDIYAPVLLSTPAECVGVYHFEIIAKAAAHVKLDLDCVTRELAIPGLNSRFCTALMDPETQALHQFCGQERKVRTCYETMVGQGLPVMDNALFWRSHPLCIPDGTQGKINFVPTSSPGPGHGVTEGPLVIVNGAANGNNIQVDLLLHSGDDIYAPVLMLAPAECVGVYQFRIIDKDAEHTKLDLDCVTGELLIPGLTPSFCWAFKDPTTKTLQQLCGPQNSVRTCAAFMGGPQLPVMDNTFFWESD
ncbi:hypothetical protein DFH09DRAFT_1270770 [Mycena vulgaris]|nr:hypothetical protein DFH09DRAFT_1270770 [Mycena vulgaris]